MTPKWVEHRIPQATRTPPPKPDVTAPEWVAWFERSMRDAAPAESLAPRPDRLPVPVPEPVALPAPASYPGPSTGTVVAACVAVMAIMTLLVGAGWWWAGRGEPHAKPLARQVDSRSRQHPPPPVPVPIGSRHTQVRVLASGDLVVEDWLRKPGGSLVHRKYELADALESTGSRGLVRLEPVDVGRSSDRTISVVGATVLALACLPSAAEVPVPCGADAGVRGWRLVGPAATPDAEVLVQLDLAG